MDDIENDSQSNGLFLQVVYTQNSLRDYEHLRRLFTDIHNDWFLKKRDGSEFAS